MTEKILFYTRFERFWHWAQALLILLLLITGFVIHGSLPIISYEHGSLSIMSYEYAVTLHNQMAWTLIGLTAFAVFWHFTTGEWRQYTPTLEKIAAMIYYYSVGIFKGSKHPVEKHPDRKLNPMQRITYFLLKVLLFPFQIITGLVYYYYNSLGDKVSLETIAFLHTAGAFAFLAFLIIHVYLATTGTTVLSHFKAMITGWEEIEADDPKPVK